MNWVRATLVALGILAPAVAAETWLDQVEERLTFSAAGGQFHSRLSGEVSLEAYQFHQPSPGFLFASGHTLFTPRLALFLDGSLGSHLTGFAQARVDRGFDPGNGRLRLRLDEYALRYAPWSDGRVQVQVGQFATVIGNWAYRHATRDNPFVSAPLPYENMTAIYDREAPVSRQEFLAYDPAEKYEYNPIIWGPAYGTGAALAGRLGKLDYAVEFKNTGPASRPEAWPFTHTGFERPAFSARMGYRPDLRWKFGISVSDSSYLHASTASALPAGTALRDFRERLLAQDASFAWGHLQIWAELFETWFDVPRVGTVRTIAGYVETKYKFTPQCYGALRWNRQGYSAIDDGLGSRQPWRNALWRLDAATGYRFTPQIDGKLQASTEHESTHRTDFVLHYAAQFNVRF